MALLRVEALLHDVGLYKAYAMREPAEHAKRSSLVAGRILNDADFPPQATRAAIEAIEAHPPGAPVRRSPYSRTPSPRTTSASSASPTRSSWSAPGTTSRTLGPPSGAPQSLRRLIPDLLILETIKDLTYSRGHETDRFMEDLGAARAGLKLL
jgi:uncharacterized protein